MGAFKRMYPATVKSPLELVQLEKETVTSSCSSFDLVDGRLRHVAGVLLENPKRRGMTRVDEDGRILMEGLMYWRT
jgi:hypothetical protein